MCKNIEKVVLMEKYVVCYSGGHSSALVAIETVRKFGKENVILLNHDLSPEVEHEDIKRFKQEVADYLGIEITYANMDGWETSSPLKICRNIKAFKVGNGTALCTNRLKTGPFNKWLKDNYPVAKGEIREDITILYGFDKEETSRIQRRIGVLISQGYKTDYPLAFWDRTISDTNEIGIKKPITYKLFRHANCIGCLKAGKQQWYLVYCLYPAIWNEAIETEKAIGYSILKDVYLDELEQKFKVMKCKGIIPSEGIKQQTFWAMVRKELPDGGENLPCDCSY